MKKGDLILVHGKYDIVSSIIRLFTHSYWNHVGIFVDKNHILEVRGRQIVISPLTRYAYNKRYDCKIVRIRGLQSDKIKKAIDYMIDITEKGYFKWVWACILAFFNSTAYLPRRTCSGLIAEAFASIDFYFRKDKHPNMITPADISKSGKTKNITGKALYKVII